MPISMNKTLSVDNRFSDNLCLKCVQSKQLDINKWLVNYESMHTPFYSSVDIRDAGFKIAVVDTNLFPAGFNNLCEHGLADAIHLVKNAVNKRVAGAQSVLIVAEDHTRNTWYLENVRILQDIFINAGFNAKIASFFTNDPSFCEQAANAIELETATGNTIKIFCFKRILNKIKEGALHFDLIIMNNDLTGGIPDELRSTNIPVFPSMHAGWHARHKSNHFKHTNALMAEFATLAGLDPWQFSCLYDVVEDADINSAADQKRLYTAGVKLFEQIQGKYKEHGIKEKPFMFVKSDSGTYGLGVIPIEDPQQILELNSRKRNDLVRGKGASKVNRYLLQEGVPTIHQIEGSPSEVCIYQIDNNLIGGFYRYNTGKNSRQNLNSPGGMAFQKMCPHLDKYGKDCGTGHNMNVFDIYRILARIAGIAAHREIIELTDKGQMDI